MKTAGCFGFSCRQAFLALFARQDDERLMVLYKQLVLPGAEMFM